MKQKIDIENFVKRTPYNVPEDYFTNLTHNIMDRIDDKKSSIFRYLFVILKPKKLVPTISIVVILFTGFWYNSQNTTFSDKDLYEILTYYEIEDELLYEIFDNVTEEEIDDNLIDQFNYEELIYELNN
tara:strand:- start:341 stop:724 length:384 start_codon:yes stop_codon:yes gene_type:complete